MLVKYLRTLCGNSIYHKSILQECIGILPSFRYVSSFKSGTSVDTHAHKLKRPVRRKPPAKAKFLKGLKERTQGSLVPQVLDEMAIDKDFQITAAALKKHGQKALTREEKKRRRRALNGLGIPGFDDIVKQNGTTLERQQAEVFQINIGIYCNQACNHCHVESSPKRKETMSRETADRCLEVIQNSPSIKMIDITGGAPELNEQFRYMVGKIREFNKDIKIIDRCNLTVLYEPGQEDLSDFLVSHNVDIIASLPCYSAKNVNFQRGSGVFDRSIRALLELNDKGYGQSEDKLTLDLVYNPIGAFLPPDQKELEKKYKEELFDEFGIEFNKLFAFSNMPIKRFADFLFRRGELQDYMSLLVQNFNVDTIQELMCLNYVNVNWNGNIYDCDFNQQLDMTFTSKSNNDLTVFDIESTDDLLDKKIQTDSHCFGCTAGVGFS